MPVSKDDKSPLYFIAFIPPTPVFEDALKLKQYFKESFNSKAALNSPPHITLHMPFRWRADKEDQLIEKLGKFVRNHDPLKICIDNFSSFPPRVIFLNVVTSEPLVSFQKSLQRFCRKELNLFNANYKEDPFHPHVTLAFRDLKKTAYATAWEEFSKKEYKAEFVADKVALLKHFTLESSYTTENTQELATTEG
jgi:2'-5' RNA ligase